jgi:hypothetical protein
MFSFAFVCQHDNLKDINDYYEFSLPKDKLIKFWLNLDGNEIWMDEKLANVCFALPGRVN